MTTRTFTVTLTSRCSHTAFNETCVWCAHLNEMARRLQERIENDCNTRSNDLKTWKPLSVEEVLPQDYIEAQHQSEYD